jgi:hypothetical protein
MENDGVEEFHDASNLQGISHGLGGNTETKNLAVGSAVHF